MERPAERLWSELRATLGAIVADLDAVLRAHLGGPTLRFESAATSGARAGLRLRVGRTAILLTLDDAGADEASSAADLVLRVGGATSGSNEILIDATNRRWWTPEDPYASHSLADRTALERFLLALLVDLPRGEPAAQDPGSSSHSAKTFHERFPYSSRSGAVIR